MSVHERNLVPRRRLLARLRDVSASTILLTAPAGYGKTTFAYQWLEQAGGSALSITQGVADVAVLSRELVAVLSDLLPIDPSPVEVALRVEQSPAEQARAVARTILRQLAPIPEYWFFIDDYHLLMCVDGAQELVGALEGSGRLKLIVASRERPSWATARRFVHLDIVEFRADDLALDAIETAQLLPPGVATEDLLVQIRGWPAALGLVAQRSRVMKVVDVDQFLSKSLYDYFAEEIFDNVSNSTQQALRKLALLPPLSVHDVRTYLDDDAALASSMLSGLAQTREDIIDVHPLARAFLMTKMTEYAQTDFLARDAAKLCIRLGRWDAAFGIIREYKLEDLLGELLVGAIPDLSESGRIRTLDEYGRYASATRGREETAPLVDLIRAEKSIREGEFEQALHLARASSLQLSENHALKARALTLAGRAAQFSHKLPEALELYAAAGIYASIEGDRVEAAWGRTSVALYLEDMESAASAINDLDHVASRPVDRLRLVMAKQHEAYLGGRAVVLEEEVREAQAVLRDVGDPWVRTAWGNMRGYALILNANYELAFEILTETLNEIDEFGLRFGRSQIEWSMAAAELGMRQFGQCERRLERIEDSYAADLYLRLNVHTLRTRLRLSQGRLGEAMEERRVGSVRSPIAAMEGEYLATRALMFVATGDVERAHRMAVKACDTTRAVDTRVLTAAVAAQIELLTTGTIGDSGGIMLESARRFGSWDAVVCAMRACPGLATQLVESDEGRLAVAALCRRSGDAVLARHVGLSESRHSSSELLSTREMQVLGFVSQGATNKEIASALFIASSTVKAHLDNAFRKLGARNRAEAAVRYAEIAAARGGRS